MSAPASPQRATRREWIGLAVLTLPCLIYSMDLTVLNLAIPNLSADLKPSASQLLWIIDIYGFLVAGCLITMGTLGDRIGRRRLLMIGAATFALASIIAAFAPTAEVLIFARALLGITGATIAPSTLSLIRNMFPDETQRTRAIAIWGTSYSVGGSVGPVIGGILLEYFWWGSVFLLAVPAMALLLIIGPRLLPEYKDPQAGHMDIISAAMSLIAVLAVIFGIKRIAEGHADMLSAASISAGVIIGVFFVIRQRKLADPLIDLSLFGRPAFGAALLTNLVCVFIAFGAFFFTAQYLQLVLGLSPLQAALWSLPSSAGVIAGSLLAPRIVQLMRPAYVVACSMALCAGGFAIISQIGGVEASPATGIAIIVTGSLIMSLGMGPVFILTTDLIIGTAPPQRAGAAAAMSETASEFGGVLGIAVLGSIGIAIYRRVISAGMPVGIPTDAAIAASGTLGGAIDVAKDLPEQASGALISVAQQAFVDGFVFVAIICSMTALAVAVLAASILRNVRGGSH